MPIRQECPPGACDCRRDELLQDPASDKRVLRLTREEEKRLVARLERLGSLAELQHMQNRIFEQLGIEVTITPSVHGVRSMRGIHIALTPQPGLCRKIRQSVPAAIRRSLEQCPEIAYALLDAGGLFDAHAEPSDTGPEPASSQAGSAYEPRQRPPSSP